MLFDEEKSSRKSGLVRSRNPFEDLDELDFDYFISPYKDFVKEYKRSLEAVERIKAKRFKTRCYIVTYNTLPNFYYIAYVNGKKADEISRRKSLRISRVAEKLATVEAQAYIKSLSKSVGSDVKVYYSGRAKRMEDLDQYADVKVAPLYNVLRSGVVKFCCANCGKPNLSFEDYENEKCFIVEDFGRYNEFTQGVLLCSDCYREYLRYNK